MRPHLCRRCGMMAWWLALLWASAVLVPLGVTAQEPTESTVTGASDTPTVNRKPAAPRNERSTKSNRNRKANANLTGRRPTPENRSRAAPGERFDTQLPDGRPLRWIGVFQSQLAEVIPQTYRPIRLEQLQQWIDSQRERSSEQTVDPVSATYVVDAVNGKLVNRSTVLQFNRRAVGRIRCDLGNVNLAIKRSPQGTTTSTLQFENDSSGNLLLRGTLAKPKPATTTAEASVDSLVTDSAATDHATTGDDPSVDSMLKVPMDWTLVGRRDDTGTEYRLRLPPTPLTTLYVSTQADERLESNVGVVREMDQPPSIDTTETDDRSASEELEPDQPDADEVRRWYRIDVGGRRDVVIRTESRELDSEISEYVVRRCSIRYQIDATGLLWTQRIEMDSPVDRSMPRLRVDHSIVTSIRLDGIEVPFEVDPDDPRQIRLIADSLPEFGSATRDQVLRLSIVGFSQARPSDDGRARMTLPLARPIDSAFISTTAIDDAQIAVQPGLLLSQWTLPEGWNKTMSQSSSQGMIHGATGPSLMDDLLAAENPSRGWSSIEWVPRSRRMQADAMMRLDADQDRLRAVKRFVYLANEPDNQPISFDVERTFTLESAQVIRGDSETQPGTKQEAEFVLRPSNALQSQLILWPSASDWQPVVSADDPNAATDLDRSVIAQAGSLWPATESVGRPVYRLTVELTGQRLRIFPGSDRWASTWFARQQDSPRRVDVAMHPPSGRKWQLDSTDTALDRPAARWSKSKNRFLRTTRTDVLALQFDDGVVPSLRTRDPGVTFDVTSQFEVDFVDDQAMLVYGMAVQSAGRSLDQIRLASARWKSWRWSLVARPSNRPLDFDNYLARRADVVLPTTQVQTAASQGDGISELLIDISPLDFRDYVLVGRSTQPARELQATADSSVQESETLTDSFRVILPSVVGASDQICEGRLAPSLVGVSGSRAVTFAPLAFEPDRQSVRLDSGNPGPPPSRDVGLPVSRSVQSFRYEPLVGTQIELRPYRAADRLSLVDRIHHQLIAGTGGNDQLLVGFDATLAAGMELSVPWEFRLVSATRNGEPFSVTSLRNGDFFLPAHQRAANYRILFTRAIRFGGGVVRSCRMPRIRTDALVLQERWTMHPRQGDFLPRLMMQTDDAPGGCVTGPGQRRWIMPMRFVLAAGWLVAILIFGIALVGLRRHFSEVVYLTLVAASVSVLWWQWNVSLMAFIIAPLVLAILTETLFRFPSHQRGTASPAPRESDRSQDFSWSLASRRSSSWLIGLAAGAGLVGSMVSPATAQVLEPETIRETLPGVKAIVPVALDGKPRGSVVYLPESIASQISPTGTSPRQPAVPDPSGETAGLRFLSARYDVQIFRSPVGTEADAAGESRLDEAEITAEYRMDLDSTPSGSNAGLWTTLPIQGEGVRQIESIAALDRRVRFQVDAISGMIRVNRFDLASDRLRIVRRIEMTRTDDQVRLLMPVAPISMCQVSVRSDSAMQTVRILSAAGAIVAGAGDTNANDRDDGLTVDGRQFDGDIGPVNVFDLQVRFRSRFDDQAMGPLRRRYFVNFNATVAAIDCEIEPSRRIVAGEYFQFVIRDADFPRSVSRDWVWVESELYSSTRRLVTLRAVVDDPGPIRLIWQREVGSEPVTLPEVIAAALGENAPALIAYHADPSVRVTSLSRGPLESMSVDQFRLSWRGYQDSISRVLVAGTQLPQWRVEPIAVGQPIVRSEQTLLVRSDRQQLIVNASISPGGKVGEPIEVRLPTAWRLTSATLNDIPVFPSVSDHDGLVRYFLGYTDPSPQIDVSLIAVPREPPTTVLEDSRPIPTRRRYSFDRFPRATLMPASKSTELYTLRRAIDVDLRPANEPTVLPLVDHPAVSDKDLEDGTLPVAQWFTEFGDGEDQPGEETRWGRWMVSPQRTGPTPEANLVVTVAEGRWKATLEIRSASKASPLVLRADSVLEVELPSSWKPTIGAVGAIRWITDSSLPSGRQRLRIWADQDINDPIGLSAPIESDDPGRLEVPSITFLNRPGTRITIQVPAESDGRDVRWKMEGMRVVENALALQDDATKRRTGADRRRAGQPPRNRLPLRGPGVFANADGQGRVITAQVMGKKWSVTRRRAESTPRQLIVQSLESLQVLTPKARWVRARLEVAPDDSQYLPIRLPAGSTWIAGSVAGQAANPLHHPSGPSPANGDDGIEKGQMLWIPLALSQLPHTIELLYQVPPAAERVDLDLGNVPIIATWYGAMVPTDLATHRKRPNSVALSRTLSLARSMVETFESVQEDLDNRQSEEVTDWIRSRQRQFQRHRRQFNHELTRIPVDQRTQYARRWQAIDGRLSQLYERYGFDGKAATADDVGVNQEVPIQQFQGMTELQLASQPLVATPRLPSESTADGSLRWLLINTLTLMFVMGGLYRLRNIWVRYRSIGEHPCVWLAALGLISAAVFPLPVSLAMITVAALFGFWPNRRRIS